VCWAPGELSTVVLVELRLTGYTEVHAFCLTAGGRPSAPGLLPVARAAKVSLVGQVRPVRQSRTGADRRTNGVQDLCILPRGRQWVDVEAYRSTRPSRGCHASAQSRPFRPAPEAVNLSPSPVDTSRRVTEAPRVGGPATNRQSRRNAFM